MKKIFFYSIGLLVLTSSVLFTFSYINYSIEEKIDKINNEKSKELMLDNFKKTQNTNFSYLDSQKPDFVEIAKKSINTVVHVKSASSSESDFSIEDFLFGRVQRKPQLGSGSGVIISSDGYIVTNHHVIENAENIQITSNNNQSYNAKIIGSDEQNDIIIYSNRRSC